MIERRNKNDFIDDDEEDLDSPLLIDEKQSISSGLSSTMLSGPKPTKVMGFKTKYGMKGPGMLHTIHEAKDERGSTRTTVFPFDK